MKINVIPEGDIYRLVANSELPGIDKLGSLIFYIAISKINYTGNIEDHLLKLQQDFS